MTEMTGKTKLEKLELVHWLLDELLDGGEALYDAIGSHAALLPDDIRLARDYIEDIREDYMDDLK